MKEQTKQNIKSRPKHESKLEALEFASLGFSIVIAIVVGVGAGLLLQNITGATWTIWIGVIWGVAAAGLNIKKAYDKVQKQLKELSDDPRYSYGKKHGYGDHDDN